MNGVLVNIDFINEIVNQEGKLAAAAAEYTKKNNIMGNANKVINSFRNKNLPIVHVKVGFSSNYVECPKNSPLFGKACEFKALQLNTWGTEFHDEMDVKEDDFIIVKHRVSALYATGLETLLRAQKCDTVFLTGVSTDMAIQTVARELHDRDYKVIVVEDACGAANKEVHDNSITMLSRIATICKANEISNFIA